LFKIRNFLPRYLLLLIKEILKTKTRDVEFTIAHTVNNLAVKPLKGSFSANLNTLMKFNAKNGELLFELAASVDFNLTPIIVNNNGLNLLIDVKSVKVADTVVPRTYPSINEDALEAFLQVIYDKFFNSSEVLLIFKDKFPLDRFIFEAASIRVVDGLGLLIIGKSEGNKLKFLA
jgi:hypothetical protein